MDQARTVTVAVVQEPPVLLDREATVAAVVRHVAEAAERGAGLIVFPETFVPGYPEWVWRLAPGGSVDYRLGPEIHARLLGEAVDLAGDHLDPVREAAAGHGAVVVLGVHEVDGRASGGTLYNTLVTIGPDGAVLNRHRKLVPTHPERMVWAPGDGSGLRVVDTPIGRLGGLICWENYMPLARFALYAQAPEIYVAATWDEGDAWVASMRHIARESRCWVIGAGCALRVDDVPADFPGREHLYDGAQEWLNPGDSVVVSPAGAVTVGPMHQEQGILAADIDLAEIGRSRYMMDIAGHYHRPDVFRFEVDRSARPSARFRDD